MIHFLSIKTTLLSNTWICWFRRDMLPGIGRSSPLEHTCGRAWVHKEAEGGNIKMWSDWFCLGRCEECRWQGDSDREIVTHFT